MSCNYIFIVAMLAMHLVESSSIGGIHILYELNISTVSLDLR